MNTLKDKYKTTTKEVQNEIVSSQGHFVQTYLTADIYRALHIRSKLTNKTLHKYLEELISSAVTLEMINASKPKPKSNLTKEGE